RRDSGFVEDGDEAVGLDQFTNLKISSVNGRTGQSVLTHNVRAGTLPAESKLVFRRYGDQYFLSQVWETGDSDGHELRKSRRETGLERDMAKNTARPEMVAINGRRP